MYTRKNYGSRVDDNEPLHYSKSRAEFGVTAGSFLSFVLDQISISDLNWPREWAEVI